MHIIIYYPNFRPETTVYREVFIDPATDHAFQILRCKKDGPVLSIKAYQASPKTGAMFFHWTAEGKKQVERLYLSDDEYAAFITAWNDRQHSDMQKG